MPGQTGDKGGLTVATANSYMYVEPIQTLHEHRTAFSPPDTRFHNRRKYRTNTKNCTSGRLCSARVAYRPTIGVYLTGKLPLIQVGTTRQLAITQQPLLGSHRERIVYLDLKGLLLEGLDCNNHLCRTQLRCFNADRRHRFDKREI